MLVALMAMLSTCCPVALCKRTTSYLVTIPNYHSPRASWHEDEIMTLTEKTVR